MLSHQILQTRACHRLALQRRDGRCWKAGRGPLSRKPNMPVGAVLGYTFGSPRCHAQLLPLFLSLCLQWPLTHFIKGPLVPARKGTWLGCVCKCFGFYFWNSLFRMLRALLVKPRPSEESLSSLLPGKGELACHFPVHDADKIPIVPKLLLLHLNDL